MNDFVININKPQDFTSHDVVAVLRGVLKTRRIGHCGTLDPMATGVLPICVGKATKASEFIMGFDKEYIASVRFGYVSDTQDITGTVVKTDVPVPGKEEILSAADRFLGDIDQIPPMYSAVKIQGQKLYALARKGVEVERPSRRVNIRYIETIGSDEKKGEYIFKIGCSKGTYIRTLCHDIGQSLGCGAVLFALERTQTGAFVLENSVTLDEIKAGSFEKGMYSLNDVFRGYPALYAKEKETALIKNGVRLEADRLGKTNPDTLYAVYEENGGALLMLAQADEGKLKMIRGFW